MFAQVVFQELGVSCVQFELQSVKTDGDASTLQLGMLECPLSDLLTSEGLKLQPQNMSMSPFSEHAYCEEACSLVAPGQDEDYLTFFLLPITFPHTSHTSDHLLLYLISIQPLTFREVDLRLFLLSPCLAAWSINPFSAANLDILAFGFLLSGQTNLVQQQLRLSTREDEKDSLTPCRGRRLGDKLASLRHTLTT